MTLSSEERAILHQAQAIKAKGRKQAKAARPKRVQPTAPEQRKPRVREPGFLAFLRRQPCCLRGRDEFGLVFCEGPIQACHIRTHKPGERPTGLQRKSDDRRATPMCANHHRLQHDMKEMEFWASYELDPYEVADEYYSQYQQLQVK